MKQSLYDCVDDNDELIAKIAGYDEVHAQGIWHRGVHVVIYTPDREVIVQKRSSTVKYYPGRLELSVGGGVDAGETPEQAAVREIQEELGVVVRASALRFIGKTTSNLHTKSHWNRVFIYNYSACIPRSELHFAINNEETSAVSLVAEATLRQALSREGVKGMGKISGSYKYWNYLLDSF